QRPPPSRRASRDSASRSSHSSAVTIASPASRGTTANGAWKRSFGSVSVSISGLGNGPLVLVTPTLGAQLAVQPHLRASAQAILKNVGGRFAAWQNLSTD